MTGGGAIDFAAAFQDVVAIAQSARTATSGWRAVCVRERRRLGASLIAPLTDLDLDDDVAKVGSAIRELAPRFARDVDTLVFGLFNAIDDDAGAYAGYHVAGVASHGRRADDFLHDPWKLERRFLRSDVLDGVARASAEADRSARPLLEYTLRFGAAALTSRFAAIGLHHRIVIAFDDDHGRHLPAGVALHAELVPAPRTAMAESLTSAMPRLLTSCNSL